MIKTYISALLVVLVASVQMAHAQQSTDEVFAQLDAANATGQTDDTSASSASSDTTGAEMFNSLFEMGVARYKEGRYDEAISIFDAVLAIDKYNAAAMTYKKRAAEQVVKKENKKQSVGRAQALAEVEAAWNAEPRVFGTVEESEDAEVASDSDQLADEQVVARLKAVTIPVFDVAEASIEEVVQFFAETSRNQSGAGEDVDILLVGMESATAENNITISVDDMNLYEALQYVVEMASLKFEIKKNLVVIMPANYVPATRMVVKSYDIIPEIGADLESAADSGGSGVGPVGVSGFFALVDFPEGASAVYQPRFHKLFIKNTPKNLKAADAVLIDLAEEAIARRSQQVEIEAKFVEFNEGALEELGFDWTVYGSGSVASMEMKEGTYFQGASGYTERTQVDDDIRLPPDDQTDWWAQSEPYIYTDPASGQKVIEPKPFLDDAMTIPNPNYRPGQNLFASTQRDNTTAFSETTAAVIGTMGGVPANMVFANGDVDLRITALEQEGTADVLSAPRVTTKSGSEALIRIAETHRYPQDYDVETGQRTTPIVRPQDWDDFDMGVSLRVTPVVDGESGTIQLELSPEILAFRGYDHYRVGINAYDKGGTDTVVGGGNAADLLASMAAFERRTVQTSVNIADGQTIMMGGLISEQTETFRDQVPILGDIPYLGRLFRTEGSRTAKKNLTIFVKASLVDTRGMTRADRELARQ